MGASQGPRCGSQGQVGQQGPRLPLLTRIGIQQGLQGSLQEVLAQDEGVRLRDLAPTRRGPRTSGAGP